MRKAYVSTSKLYSWFHWHTLGTRITTPVHHPVPSSANSQALLSTIVKLLLIRITAHQRRVKKYTYFSSIRGSAILYFNRCPFYRIDDVDDKGEDWTWPHCSFGLRRIRTRKIFRQEQRKNSQVVLSSSAAGNIVEHYLHSATLP